MNWLPKTIPNKILHNIDIIVQKYKTESSRTEAPVEGYVPPIPHHSYIDHTHRHRSEKFYGAIHIGKPIIISKSLLIPNYLDNIHIAHNIHIDLI